MTTRRGLRFCCAGKLNRVRGRGALGRQHRKLDLQKRTESPPAFAQVIFGARE